MTTTRATDLQATDTINLYALVEDYGITEQYDDLTAENPYARVSWVSDEDDHETYIMTDRGSVQVQAVHPVDLGESENWN